MSSGFARQTHRRRTEGLVVEAGVFKCNYDALVAHLAAPSMVHRLLAKAGIPKNRTLASHLKKDSASERAFKKVHADDRRGKPATRVLSRCISLWMKAVFAGSVKCMPVGLPAGLGRMLPAGGERITLRFRRRWIDGHEFVPNAI